MELIGRKIAGRFEIEAFVGGGAMGAVYRARQIELDKVVAIKVLHEKLASEPEFLGRFKREAKAASLIDHPNSMRVIEFGQEPDGLLYIAMEFLEGPSLHRVIKGEGPLDPERVVSLGRQILGALAAAHDLEILHRDLKPENVIIVSKTDDEGRSIETVKVCDFGIAKVGSGASTTASGGKLTSAGSIVGTPDYMPPEQARGKHVDARSDLYSVGVILYEMMTGRVPFVASTPLAVVLMHLNEEPQRPSELNPAVDPHLEEVALRAMSKDPDRRFSSAREMRGALALEGAPNSMTLVPSIHLTEKKPRSLEVVAPEASLATGATLVASATDVTGSVAPSTPKRVPSAAELLEEPPALPTHGSASSVVIVVALLLLIGGGAFLYWRGRSQVATPTTGTDESVIPTPPTVTQEPAPPLVSVAPTVMVSARPSASGLKTPPPPSAVPASASGSNGAPVVSIPDAASSAAPALPPSPAHVIVGAISAKDVAPNDIAAALPVARFNQCYRDGVSGQAKPLTGQAQLHLVILANSTEAKFAGPPGFEAIAACITRVAGSVAVAVPAAGGTADVELTFKVD